MRMLDGEGTSGNYSKINVLRIYIFKYTTKCVLKISYLLKTLAPAKGAVL
jgi:hypothetical protein